MNREDLTEEQIQAIIDLKSTSPWSAYNIERALRPATNAAEWLATYEKWKDKGVNLEGLLLQGQVENWIPPDIAAELLG